MVPSPKLAIEVGKLESINDSTAGDDVTQKSRESIFAPGAPSVDYSKSERLTRITPLMVAAMNKNHQACKLLVMNVKKIRKWDKPRLSMFINMQLSNSLGGLNPLLIACKQGDYILFDYLVK